MTTYFVYIMTNYKNTVLYTGITNNLVLRVYQHKSEEFEGFTKKYHLTKLIFYETFSNPADAISAEKKIKGWTRDKKENLIKKSNPNWDDLSEKILR